MKNINLQKGLIAIGSGKGEGKTRFALKLANFLAETENVLFINYSDYSEKLIEAVKKIDENINKNLDINNRFGYYGSEVFLDIIKYIKTNKISTVFIDDIESFSEISTEETFLEDTKYNIIEDLKYISEMLDVRIIFLTSTSKSQYDEIYQPKLKNLKWSRAISNECNQIFVLYRPSYYGFTTDENNNYTYDKIEIHCLKNIENTNNNEILILNNKEENLFNI